VKVAERFGQPPHLVADWPPDWLAVCQTAMAAENGAEAEIRRREDRQARMRQKAGR
jgi:hypothetical protein